MALAIFYSQEDGGFIAVDPAWPGLSAFGDTEEEAGREFEIARGAAVEVYLAEGWELPKDVQP